MVSAGAAAGAPGAGRLVKVGDYHQKYARQGAACTVLGDHVHVVSHYDRGTRS